jgi:hypothetical protein
MFHNLPAVAFSNIVKFLQVGDGVHLLWTCREMEFLMRKVQYRHFVASVDTNEVTDPVVNRYLSNFDKSSFPLHVSKAFVTSKEDFDRYYLSCLTGMLYIEEWKFVCATSHPAVALVKRLKELSFRSLNFSISLSRKELAASIMFMDSIRTMTIPNAMEFNVIIHEYDDNNDKFVLFMVTLASILNTHPSATVVFDFNRDNSRSTKLFVILQDFISTILDNEVGFFKCVNTGRISIKHASKAILTDETPVTNAFIRALLTKKSICIRLHDQRTTPIFSLKEIAHAFPNVTFKYECDSFSFLRTWIELRRHEPLVSFGTKNKFGALYFTWAASTREITLENINCDKIIIHGQNQKCSVTFVNPVKPWIYVCMSTNNDDHEFTCMMSTKAGKISIDVTDSTCKCWYDDGGVSK